MKKKLPFSVPNNYFEQLPYTIQDKIYQQKSRNFWQKPLFQWVLTISTCLLLGFYLNVKTYKPSFEKQLSTLSSQEISTYLQIYEIEEDEVIELILNTEYEPKAADFMAFSKEEINNYLDKNDVEQDEYYEYEEFMD